MIKHITKIGANGIQWRTIGIIALLPIILAIINPNWIFNAWVIDDYHYLGYQLALPKYVGWSPADGHYFIERISWLLPTYWLRQITSPLVANFIIHLTVYYVAIFSFYAVVNRLYRARIALITTLLLGQFPLFLRSTGNDYVDGFSLALLCLCLMCLTYSATSEKYWRRYLIGAGAIAMLIINAQPFNVFYFPALGIYYLLLNHRHYRRHILWAIIMGAMSALAMFALLTIAYYLLTGKWWIFANSLGATQSLDDWRGLNERNYSYIFPGWHILYIGVMLIGITIIAYPKRFAMIYDHESPHFIYYLRMSLIFAVSCYSILWGWLIFLQFSLFQPPFYSTNVLPSIFLLLAGLFAKRIDQLSPKYFRQVLIATLIIPIGLLTLYTFSPPQLIPVLFSVSMISGMLVFCFSFTVKRQRALIFLIWAVGLLSYPSGIDRQFMALYLPNRLTNQHVYETIVQASDIIDARYDTYAPSKFRLWNGREEMLRLPRSLSALYHNRGIIPELDSDPDKNSRWDTALFGTEETILITTEFDAEEMLAKAQAILDPLGYDITFVEEIWLQNGDIRMGMIFTTIRPRAN
jgi:hypothetical protein